VVPYLEGERTPSKPTATGAVHGMTLANATQANLARAAVEGMLCGLADGLDALVAAGVPVRRVLLVGGGARAEAVRRIAPTVLGQPVLVPPAGEYVADGAARQAAWTLSGAPLPPEWTIGATETFDGAPEPAVRDRYAAARDHVIDQRT
jgi:xylulokinase